MDNLEVTNRPENPVAQQVIEKWKLPLTNAQDSPKKLTRFDAVAEELQGKVDFADLSNGQQKEVQDAFAYSFSHRPDNVYYFLESGNNTFLPRETIQEGMKEGLQDICLNAPSEAGGGYVESWKTLLGSIRMQMPGLKAETRNDVAKNVVDAIADATMNDERYSAAGEGHRNTQDIEFVVRMLVDKGDAPALQPIVERVKTLADSMKQVQDANRIWMPNEGKRLETEVLPKLELHGMPPTEAINP